MPDIELLRAASKEALVATIQQLQTLVRAQERTIAEIVNERNAALMWNELYLRSEAGRGDR